MSCPHQFEPFGQTDADAAAIPKAVGHPNGMPNLVELYTVDGPMHIDTAQLARRRTHLTIYDGHGRRVKDAGRTRAIREAAEYGVHFDNLYATQALANATADALYAQLPQLLEAYASRATD